MRSRLAEGLPRLRAARRTTAEFTPIILTAGLVVAGGIAALVVARVSTLAAFGPALALTVVTAMAVALTLTPAAGPAVLCRRYTASAAHLRRRTCTERSCTETRPPALIGAGSSNGSAGRAVSSTVSHSSPYRAGGRANSSSCGLALNN